MRLRAWHLLLVAAALAVPIQAGALSGGKGGGLTVSASLDYCGTSGNGISCKIDVSWNGVEGAERYSAVTTLADGTVLDLGTVGSGPGGGSSSIWVPYAGDGLYTVTITAWGNDPDGKDKELDREKSGAELGDREGPGKGEQDGEKDSGSEKGDEPSAGGKGDAPSGDPGGGAGPKAPDGKSPPEPEPEAPSEPGAPSEPEAPSEPAQPADPEIPGGPEEPAEPTVAQPTDGEAEAGAGP